MGYNTILDIIGSIFVAGTLLIIVLNLQGDISQMTYTYGNDYIVQSNMTNLTKMLESDFRRIGYWAALDSPLVGTKAIRAATKHSISFLADMDDNGILDTVKYWVGTTTDLAITPNPKDFPLYRQINSNPAVMYNFGVTQFDFKFWQSVNQVGRDSLQFPITFNSDGTSLIFYIELQIMLQSRESYDSVYTYSYWKQLRLEAQNLKNR
jgi:hypothetical protein